MKRYLSILITVMVLFSLNAKAQCNDELQSKCYEMIKGTTYLKDFKVRLQAAEKNKKAPIAKFSIALSKGAHYRFTVSNDQYKNAEAIIQVYDGSDLIGSNYLKDSDKIFPKFDFICNKTGVYTILISFKDGHDGCSVAMLSLVE